MTLAQTQKLCNMRAPKQPDLSIARVVATLRRTARNAEKRAGGAAYAVECALPPGLLPHIWIESCTSAQLTLGVESAAAAYQVDRSLREGGLTKIRNRLMAPSLRVRTRVGRPPGEPTIGSCDL